MFLARSLSRTREFAADRAAARLTGSPATVAALLKRLGDVAATPGDDARAASRSSTGRERVVGHHGLCFLPGGFGTDDDVPDAAAATHGGDTDDQFGSRVETRSHPPAADRIARLRDLAAAMERGDL